MFPEDNFYKCFTVPMSYRPHAHDDGIKRVSLQIFSNIAALSLPHSPENEKPESNLRIMGRA